MTRKQAKRRTPPKQRQLRLPKIALARFTVITGALAAIVITWRLDAGATADEAKFVVTQASSVSGNPDSTEVDSYIIDHAGNIKSIEVVVTKGVIIRTLSGPKLTQ